MAKRTGLKQYGSGNSVDRIVIGGPDFDTIRARILSAPDQVIDSIANQLEQVGEEAVITMKTIITASTTATGAARSASGGNGPGRIDTGKMIDSVTSVTRKNKRSISLRFGWLGGRPGYAFFQEYGTSNGVPAMHALTDARLEADIKLRQILGSL